MIDTFDLAPNLTAKLVLSKFPSVEFYTQKTPLPAINAIYPKLQGSIIKTPMPPSSINYNPFQLEFLLTEDCSNYRTLFEWLQGSISTSVPNTFSDASLLLLDSSRNIVQTIVFTDMLPIAIGEITWVTTDPSIRYQVCDATFDYTIYNFT